MRHLLQDTPPIAAKRKRQPGVPCPCAPACLPPTHIVDALREVLVSVSVGRASLARAQGLLLQLRLLLAVALVVTAAVAAAAARHGVLQLWWQSRC
jgi:hypothetical protein